MKKIIIYFILSLLFAAIGIILSYNNAYKQISLIILITSGIFLGLTIDSL